MSKTQAKNPQPEHRLDLLREIWKVLKHDKTALFGFIFILGIVAVAILAPIISPYGYSEQHILDSFQGPNTSFFLGTDEFGRDLFSRIIWGSRPALLVGVLSVLVSIGIGVPIGLLAGYKMGWVDRVVSWWVDVALSFPSILLGLMIVILLGPGIVNVALAIGISHVAQYVRLARGPTMAIRNLDFVMASKALGATDLRIAFGHILPNIVGPIVIMGTLSIAGAIRMEASLSFLGFGVTPPTPSWGNLIRDGVDNILQSPWMALFPGLALTFSVLAFNMVGDSLRDMFDPRAGLGKKKG
ncbi:MAG: ABC transporter permease [Desulfosarcina sp.]|nr:ABC transporter permease [Desulfosarcina sp.]MBC2742199.1 ABC transporter permease [Desulfosarcina sp.]MBC2765111.1 ABC transporter permease [Desulfosarcina sp.]